MADTDYGAIDEGTRWSGKLQYIRIPLDSEGREIPVEPSKEDIIEFDLDAHRQPVYPLGKWFVQAALFDAAEREEAIKNLSCALEEIRLQLAVLNHLIPLPEMWRDLINSGVTSLHSTSTKGATESEKKRATKALRDVSGMFVKKFKRDSMQPWLAELKSKNEKLWNENRHTAKRHDGNLMFFVMRSLSYFDACLNSLRHEMEEAKKKEWGSPRQIADLLIERVYHDEPGTQQSLKLAIDEIHGMKFIPKHKPDTVEELPDLIAWVIVCRSNPKVYFNVVWPFLEAEWKKWPANLKESLPRGTSSKQSPARKSAGVFRQRCFAITKTLLRDYRYFGIPDSDDALRDSLARHSTWGHK